jgi:signal transduction histidine kinase
MFKNLRTSTKLILLCAMFGISAAVATYNFVAEKQIAISFAGKELVGSKFLAALRNIYVALLNSRPFDPLALDSDSVRKKMLEALAAAQAVAAPALQTAETTQAVLSALSRLDNSSTNSEAIDALAKMQQLATRIGDDSNLTLDTDLDTYYLQNILVDQVPKLLGFVGELQLARLENTGSSPFPGDGKAHIPLLSGLTVSSANEIKEALTAAYRGNLDGNLKRSVDSIYASLFSAANTYLAGVRSGVNEGAGNNSLYEAVVNSANNAWAKSQSDLDRLLQARVDRLLARMRLSLAITTALISLSIIMAVITYRQIAKPLERLERIASTVRETKNYDLRVKHNSTDDIGRVASAFDDMLAELASARDRERVEQSELARTTRLTTMGAMTASIAHEINQPLTAIVANGQAAQRWLSNAPPDLAETRAALMKIVEDGRRAGNIIESVRGMFKKDSGERDLIDVDEIVLNVLALVKSEIRTKGISVQTDMPKNLPQVLAGRTQLQQVIMNLTMNAIEAMDAVAGREKMLVIKSAIQDPASVLITVEDTGTGIDPQVRNRLFEPLFTTKSSGMGMGLSICRSIIEGYGGHLWASPREPHGSAFHVVLLAGTRSRGDDYPKCLHTNALSDF